MRRQPGLSLEAAETLNSGLHRALENTGVGVLALDARGIVVFKTDIADSLLCTCASVSIEDGALVLRGTEGSRRGDVEVIVTWRQDGADVRQEWQVSRDGGATWRDGITLVYSPNE